MNLHNDITKQNYELDKILKEYGNSKYDDIISKNNELDKIYKEYEKILNKSKIGCRILSKCFTNGDPIRHIIKKNQYGLSSCWEGVYLNNTIIYDGKTYKSLSAFAGDHINIEKPNRKTKNSNGWSDCEYKVNGKWISTFNISEK